MKTTFRGEQFAVFDDVLPPPQFEALWDLIEQGHYRSVHAFGVEGVWRPEDGNPLVAGLMVMVSPQAQTQLPATAGEGPRAITFYPTRSAADHLFDAVRATAAEVPQLVGGAEGEGWLGITGNPYVYPQGTGFSWHLDELDYSGAYIYYAHPQWNAQWGGELLLAEVAPGSMPGRSIKNNQFGNSNRFSDSLLEVGMGRYVAPKPNRLIVLAGSVPHMINKVSPAAGNNVRASVAGFFIRPEPMRSRLKALGP